MSGMKSGFIVALMLFTLNGAGADACDSKQNGGARPANSPQAKETPQSNAPAGGEDKVMNGEGQGLKVLAQGGYGQVEEPFLVVARDAEVYAALRSLVDELPEVGADHFKTHAVVAAFLGMRSSGGYTVGIEGTAGGGLLISEKGPPKGSMTTQALTNPFKVVDVPVRAADTIELRLQGKLATTLARPYRITSGEFETSGGITGRGEKFRLEGTLGVARREKLATMLFDLKSAGAKNSLTLKSAATAIVKDDGQFVIASMDAGTLVSKPRSALQVSGRLTADAGRLSLVFKPLPAPHPESFAGSGRVEAEATAPATGNAPNSM